MPFEWVIVRTYVGLELVWLAVTAPHPRGRPQFRCERLWVPPFDGDWTEGMV